MARSMRPRCPAAKSTSSIPTPQPSSMKPAQPSSSTPPRLLHPPLTSQSRPRPLKLRRSHYIWDLTFDSVGTPLHRDRQSRGGLPRRPYQARRSPRAVLQERRGAYPHSGVGREGESDRRLRRLRPRVSHQPARQGLRALRGSAARDHIHRDRCERNHLRGMRGRQEPQSAASACPCRERSSITITVVQPQSLQAANASASVPEGTEIYALSEGRRRARSGPARTTIVYALAARPDGLLAHQRQSRADFRIQDDGSYADIAICRRSRVSRLPRCRSRRHGRSSTSAPATPARVYACWAQTRNARIRQRRSGCRRLRPLWPRGD